MSLAGTSITESDRERWLAERQMSIGSSEAAAAIGISPWETPLHLYLRKTGATPPVEETPAMRWGTLLEPVIAEEYARVTGHHFIAAQKFLRSLDRSWMTATLDRLRDDGRLVELKTVGARSASQWGDPGSDEVPVHYLIQVHHQMIVAGAEVTDVAALIAGQEMRIFTIHRDDDVAAQIVEREAEFWSRVERRDPPPVDPARDGRLMATLFPRAVGEVKLGPWGDALVEEYEFHGGEIKQHQEGRERAKVALLSAMREASSARLSDRRILTRKLVTVAEQQVTRKSYSYVDLRIRKGS